MTLNLWTSPAAIPLDIAKKAILTEANALYKLAESLDAFLFEQALSIISQTKGRLIVSGIGKSGHIGNKIAATFASTGQPSFFIHPSEASHGDLGMITKEDVLLLISNSGEAKELTAIIDYCHRLTLPMISITGDKHSTLARFSTVPLILPKALEACPMGLAPTTSTTLALALGDALAITLLTQRGFSQQQFHTFHPGGNLGQQLRRVKRIMHTDAPFIHSQTLMSDALVHMTSYGFGCIGIVDQHHSLMGIITDGDLRRHMNPQLLTQAVDEVMTKNPFTISPDYLIADAMAIFEAQSITSLFVVDETKTILGIVRLLDCLKNNVA